MEKLVVPLLIIIWLISVIIYVSALIHTHQTCDGHVVKNVFDWPVCVH